MRRAVRQLLRRQRERHPYISRLWREFIDGSHSAWETEGGRHYAYNGHIFSVHQYRAADDVGVLAESPLPERLADDHHLALARILLLRDRKSTRLNSSHSSISYAVFC